MTSTTHLTNSNIQLLTQEVIIQTLPQHYESSNTARINGRIIISVLQTGRPGNYKVEKLAFYNHTECHCVEKSAEVMSSDAAPDEDRYPLRPGPSTDVKTTSVQGQALAEPLKRYLANFFKETIVTPHFDWQVSMSGIVCSPDFSQKLQMRLPGGQ